MDEKALILSMMLWVLLLLLRIANLENRVDKLERRDG